LALLIELVIIIVAGAFINAPYMNMNPKLRLTGNESEYLMASITVMKDALDKEGRIPLWDPYLEFGEPLVNNPFIYLFNPISSVPSLLLGSINGIKISIILSTIVAGLGGWVLGRILGLRGLARVVLGLLLMGKGNMNSMLYAGFYQLDVAQAYFPWVLAGCIGLLWYKKQRWPIVLTVISIALMFWTGLLWFLLPFALILATLFLFHIFQIRRVPHGRNLLSRLRLWIDYSMVRRMILAGAATVALCMISLLPLWVNRNYLGQSSITVDPKYDVGLVMSQFFSGDTDQYYSAFGVYQLWYYYSYVLPGWFAIALVALLALALLAPQPLPIAPRLWRVILACILMFIFCTFWGAGQNPIIDWAYTAIPLVSQFRYVMRVLGVASFLVGTLGAILLDIGWVALVANSNFEFRPARVWKILRIPFLVLLVVASSVATVQVLSKYNIMNEGGLKPESPDETACVEWLHKTYPNEPLSVWTVNYFYILSYLRNDARHYRIATDFYHAQGEPSEIGPVDLIQLSIPRWAIVFEFGERNWAHDTGYVPFDQSPISAINGLPCIMQNTNALSYMYTASAQVLNGFTSKHAVDASATTPVTTFVRDYDHIGAIVTSSSTDDTYLTAQEVDYPGWYAELDGRPTKVVSVGGEIGVALPTDGQTHRVLFYYHPPLLFIGAFVTILTIILLILYLLRADRFIPESWQATIAKRAIDFLLNEKLLEPKEDLDFDSFTPKLKQLSPPKPIMLPQSIEADSEPEFKDIETDHDSSNASNSDPDPQVD
jgi:hypothetical protein